MRLLAYLARIRNMKYSRVTVSQRLDSEPVRVIVSSRWLATIRSRKLE